MPPEESANLSQHAEGQQELMQTEGENRLLRHRLNTHRDQATGIESSLAEVAQLTEVFTQQVMQQSEQIELLYTEVSRHLDRWNCPEDKSAFSLQMPQQLHLSFTVHLLYNTVSAFV